MSLSVSGRPPTNLLTDASQRGRLSPLVPNLQAALSNAGLSPPTASGKLAETDLQKLLYYIQLFQHEILGPEVSSRPANPEASNPLARHPPRIPASCFRTTASLTSKEAAPANSAVFDLLEAALTFLAQRGDKSVEIAREKVNTELIAAIRERLRQKGWIKRFKIGVEGDFSEAEKENVRKMAESLECE